MGDFKWMSIRTYNTLSNAGVLKDGMSEEDLVDAIIDLAPTPQERSARLLKTRNYGRMTHKEVLSWLDKMGMYGVVDGRGRSATSRFGLDAAMCGVLYRNGYMLSDDTEESFRKRLLDLGPRLKCVLMDINGFGPTMLVSLQKWLGVSADHEIVETMFEELKDARKEIEVLKSRLRRINDIAKLGGDNG